MTRTKRYFFGICTVVFLLFSLLLVYLVYPKHSDKQKQRTNDYSTVKRENFEETAKRRGIDIKKMRESLKSSSDVASILSPQTLAMAKRRGLNIEALQSMSYDVQPKVLELLRQQGFENLTDYMAHLDKTLPSLPDQIEKKGTLGALPTSMAETQARLEAALLRLQAAPRRRELAQQRHEKERQEQETYRVRLSKYFLLDENGHIIGETDFTKSLREKERSELGEGIPGVLPLDNSPNVSLDRESTPLEWKSDTSNSLPLEFDIHEEFTPDETSILSSDIPKAVWASDAFRTSFASQVPEWNTEIDIQYPDVVISTYLTAEEFSAFFPTEESKAKLQVRQQEMQADIANRIERFLAEDAPGNRDQKLSIIRDTLSETWSEEIADSVIERLK